MEVFWIWLSTLPFVGPVFQKRLINHFHSPNAVYKATRDELETVKGLNKRAIASIMNNRSLKESELIANKVIKLDIKMLTYDDSLYPETAKSCNESPILLFYRGNLKPFQIAIAVVGSRRCTTYGRKVAEEIGEQLACLHVPAISGFAKGIDSYVHAACVKNGGEAIVFLAGGVDVCYPKEQLPLYEKILEKKGVILSQYPPGIPPKPKYFLQRNALISAWSTELILVEASRNSGSLWTVKFAKRHGRKVYAVPNQIHVPEGAGANQLLSQGAEPYLGINCLQSIKNGIKKNRFGKRAIQENHILEVLSELPDTTDSISSLLDRLNINEHLLMNELLDLELEGKIILRGNIVEKL